MSKISPEELRWIARIANEWDSETEREFLAELKTQIDIIPSTILESSVETVKTQFEAFYTQMLRRYTALLRLRHRAFNTCDQLVASYLPQVTSVALLMPTSNLLPSWGISSGTSLDGQDAFLVLLRGVNEGLRILWMWRNPAHIATLEQSLFETTPIEGYELCINSELQRQLYLFNHMKMIVSEPTNDLTTFDLLHNLFVGIRDALTDFITAFQQNPIAATLGTLDGTLEGLGFYFLVDAIIYGLDGSVYAAHNFVDNINIALGNFPTRAPMLPPEWGATREYAADVFWLAIQGLGGEDVRNSEAFQDTRNVAQPITTVVTFFQGIRSLYNFIQRASSTTSAALSFSDDVVQMGANGAAALRLEQTIQVVDSIPWPRAAEVLNVIRASVLAFSSGDGGGANDIVETPEGRRVSRHIFDRSSDDLQHFDPLNIEDLQQIDDIIDDYLGTFVSRQSDGAGAYIRRVEESDWTLVIYNEENNTIVTAIRGMTWDQIAGRARNYGFEPPPLNWRIFNE